MKMSDPIRVDHPPFTSIIDLVDSGYALTVMFGNRTIHTGIYPTIEECKLICSSVNRTQGCISLNEEKLAINQLVNAILLAETSGVLAHSVATKLLLIKILTSKEVLGILGHVLGQIPQGMANPMVNHVTKDNFKIVDIERHFSNSYEVPMNQLRIRNLIIELIEKL